MEGLNHESNHMSFFKSHSGVLAGFLVAIALLATGQGCVAGRDGGSAASTSPTTTGSALRTSGSATSTRGASDGRITARASDLRVQLNTLLRQHVYLTAITLRSGFSGQQDFQAAARAVEDNSVRLGRLVGDVYGSQAEQRFLETWRGHVNAFVEYALASKNNNAVARDKALQELDKFPGDLAHLFSQLNPNLNRSEMERMFRRHVELTRAALDAHISGNYASCFLQLRSGDDQAGEMADELFAKIIKQYPDKY